MHSYVAAQARTSDLGEIADRTLDVEAIFEINEPQTEGEEKFGKNIRHMFYTFVRTGELPGSKDVTKGMYVVWDVVISRMDYPPCEFWKDVFGEDGLRELATRF